MARTTVSCDITDVSTAVTDCTADVITDATPSSVIDTRVASSDWRLSTPKAVMVTSVPPAIEPSTWSEI
jgi:hypothetical protein